MCCDGAEINRCGRHNAPTVTASSMMLLLTRAQNSVGMAPQLLQPAAPASSAAVQLFAAAHGHAEQPSDALCCREQLHMQQTLARSSSSCGAACCLSALQSHRQPPKPEIQHRIVHRVTRSKRSSCGSTKRYMHGESNSRLTCKSRYALPHAMHTCGAHQARGCDVDWPSVLGARCRQTHQERTHARDHPMHVRVCLERPGCMVPIDLRPLQGASVGGRHHQAICMSSAQHKDANHPPRHTLVQEAQQMQTPVSSRWRCPAEMHCSVTFRSPVDLRMRAKSTTPSR